MPSTLPKHFSLIREFHLADVLTLGNAACGLARRVRSAMLVHRRAGRMCIFRSRGHETAALLFDGSTDGSLAGGETFRARPRIGFAGGHHLVRRRAGRARFRGGLRGGWDWIGAQYFVCCGVSRLARYNITAERLSEGQGKVAYFEGTPIPTTIVLTGLLALAAWQGRLGANLWWGTGPSGHGICIYSRSSSSSPAA